MNYRSAPNGFPILALVSASVQQITQLLQTLLSATPEICENKAIYALYIQNFNV